MTPEKYQEEIYRLGHAIQSAIKLEMACDPSRRDPKHLRVGIDTTKADVGALVQLLIDKGVITEQEFFESNIRGLEKELELHTRTARELTDHPGLTFE